MSSKHQGPIRWHSRVGGPYTVEAILPYLVAGETRELDGFRVKFGSVRLQTFITGVTADTACVRCGLAGTFFALDRDFGGGVHLNLYAVAEDGREVLMTSDHIHPKSQGGTVKHISNRQPMCEECNHAKAAGLETDVQVPKPLRGTAPVSFEALHVWVEERRQLVDHMVGEMWELTTCICGASHDYDNPGCVFCNREIGVGD